VMNLRSILVLACWTLLSAAGGNLVAAEPKADYPIRPVPFSAVTIGDGFWSPRLETNRRVTINYDFAKCEETGRIDNFAKAGHLMPGEFRGIFFDDSDVYKIIEGAAYSLAVQADPKLDAYLDALIVKIAAAQEPDGYLYTARTLNPENPPQGSGKHRWENERESHETYNLGHLLEAGVAHHQATGKRSLLDVAIKAADLLDRTFGPNGRHEVPGHQEVEIGLVKLYRETGDERYLRLAKFFLDERGRADHHTLYGVETQDHVPVIQQSEAVGHAVRAAYMYSGMADVAALTGDDAYIRAIDRLWENVVSRKLYLTGGIGARAQTEAFGADYELPNKQAYNETCAAIALAMWAERMFLLHGDSKYIDVLERVVYNGFLAGVSLQGDKFFYPNPLACDGRSPFNIGTLGRAPWFACSCCPGNVVRFVPSLPGYVFAVRDRTIFVNLFVGDSGRVPLADQTVKLSQSTRYPWDGVVAIKVEPERAADFELRVRIPGWATGTPLPSSLYRYAESTTDPVSLKVNGERADFQIDHGYAVLARHWQAGDTIELDLPMPIHRVLADDPLVADHGRVALERGPIVYCAEAIDNGGNIAQLSLSDDMQLSHEWKPDLLGGVEIVRAQLPSAAADEKASVITAIPYYAWAHRAMGEMAVWLPRVAGPRPAPTLASTCRATASHTWEVDTPTALNDQLEPASSEDDSVPRFTWWNHLGSVEWVEYDFPQAASVQGAEVFWYDDRRIGGRCRVPASWRILYRDGDEWKPVLDAAQGEIAMDRFNSVSFSPVTTTALRLEVQLQPNLSSGVLEWKLR
jgi:uncharacterized protein